MAQSHNQRAGSSACETETDRTADVDVDLEGNTLHVEATVVQTKTHDVVELFAETPDDPVADARLKTSVDPGFGWSGFEIRDEQLFKVNYQETEGSGAGRYLDEDPATHLELVDDVRDCVEDDDVGLGYGNFARRRSGAGF